MTTRRIKHIAAIASLALAVAVAGGAQAGADRAQAPQPPPSVEEPEGLLRWMAAHPQHAGLVVLPDRGRPSLAFGAQRRFPLGSTRKILIAGALAASGERLSTRVPRAEVERYYVPGTDGGAHERAELHPTRPTIGQLVRAMVEVSDNATADALLQRLGRRAVDDWARRQGVARQDPIYPVLGEFAAWTRDPRWTLRSPASRARRAQALADRVLPGAVALPPIPEQRRLVRSSVAGDPSEWAELMRRIGLRGDPRLVHVLDWPRRGDESVRRAFDRFLAKGGTLPGTITEAAYMRPRGRGGVAVALFLRDLPAGVEATLHRTFTQQQVMIRLATDPAFLERARTILGSGGG